jgi:hypothetical protein
MSTNRTTFSHLGGGCGPNNDPNDTQIGFQQCNPIEHYRDKSRQTSHAYHCLKPKAKKKCLVPGSDDPEESERLKKKMYDELCGDLVKELAKAKADYEYEMAKEKRMQNLVYAGFAFIAILLLIFVLVLFAPSGKKSKKASDASEASAPQAAPPSAVESGRAAFPTITSCKTIDVATGSFYDKLV